MCRDVVWVKWGWLTTLRAWSLSSSCATSLPQACAILLPATRLPTIIEAGPTSVQHNQTMLSYMPVKLAPTFTRRQHKHIWRVTWLFLSWLGQVGDTCVRAHENIARVQRALQEALFCIRYMDATQRSFRKRVGRHQSQAVHSNLVDAVNGLETYGEHLSYS